MNPTIFTSERRASSNFVNHHWTAPLRLPGEVGIIATTDATALFITAANYLVGPIGEGPITLPTTEAIVENSDVPIERSIVHVECVHDHSTEGPTTMSQKRKSDSNYPHGRKKGRMSGPQENSDIEQTTTVGSSRNSKRTSARAGLGGSVIEQPIARRTSARRVAEIWSPERLLSNPKSKLASCNLKVHAVKA